MISISSWSIRKGIRQLFVTKRLHGPFGRQSADVPSSLDGQTAMVVNTGKTGRMETIGQPAGAAATVLTNGLWEVGCGAAGGIESVRPGLSVRPPGPRHAAGH